MLPYRLIATQQQLGDLIPVWHQTAVLAMDTEVAHAHQMASRKQTLSLVQLWDGHSDHIWLIDALAVKLEPFVSQIMTSATVTKIFHDAPVDLRFLKCPRRARSVICTLVMAQERQQPKCSLKALAADLLGYEMDKRYQRSNWALRPLSPEQLHYAAMDAWVTYQVWQQLSLIAVSEKSGSDSQR